MKTLTGLIALIGLMGADVAVARVQTVMKTGRNGGVEAIARVSYRTPAAQSSVRKPGVRKAAVHKASLKRKTSRKARRPLLRTTTVVAKANPAEKRTVAFHDDAITVAPDRPGWFKAPDRAGYGVSKGGAETMVGLYTRPERPDLPGPELYQHEGRGAAGVSLSLKLGH